MKCKEIIEKIEQWAPREIAWERDNAGLQVGSVEREAQKIFLTLDLTEPALEKAIQQNCSLIITHHPLLFHPLKRIDTHKDFRSRLIEKLIQHRITLYSAHTNLDYTKNGVSFELAERLKLRNINFLAPIKANQSKVVVFLPEDALEEVSSAIFSGGGGIIGEYTGCSFRNPGKGTFRGSKNANPDVGEKEKFETVDELRLEFIAENWKINSILSEIRKVHPYEEPSYDVLPLSNNNVNYGAGAVGELESPMSQEKFLEHVSGSLGIKNYRYSGKADSVKKVAVCGGSGSEYLNDTLKYHADAFITADLKFHTFQETEEKILLIDAGHYETEIFALDAIEKYLTKSLPGIEIMKFTDSNPVFFFNNQGAK